MLTIQKNLFINHALELYIQKNGYWDLIKQGYSIPFFVKMSLHFLLKKHKCVHDWKKIWNEILIFSFGQNIDNILNKKVDICATFRTKYGLNKMHLFMVS
jgi:hypothetical protein